MIVSNVIVYDLADLPYGKYWIELDHKCYALNSNPQYLSLGYRGFDTFDECAHYHHNLGQFVDIRK